jgi:hybrid cluster-associated redox disulfide protein
MKRSSASPDPGWTIDSLLDHYPRAASVLLRHGMACVGCAMAPFETLADAAREYRLDPAEILAELRRDERRGGGKKENRD